MRILIVDDESLERKVMRKMMIAQYGVVGDVQEAENGRKAVELAETFKPHLIFMDIKMPGMTGLEASQKIRAKHPHIKIILVSAYDTFEYAKQAMQYGIKDYLLKPSKKGEVLAVLDRMQAEIHDEQTAHVEQQKASQLLKESLVYKIIRQQTDGKVQSLFTLLYPIFRSCYFLVFNKEEEKSILLECLQQYVAADFVVVETKSGFICLVVEKEEVGKADQLILAKKLSTHTGNRLYVGIGHTFTRLKDAWTSYEEAYAACFYYKANAKNHYGFLPKQGDKTAKELSKEIISEVENGNEELAGTLFRDFREIGTKIDHDYLYILLQTRLEGYGLESVEMPISTLHTKEDWHAFLKIVCHKMAMFNQSNQSMQIAKEYIQEKYGELLTLEEVASVVQLSPPYFSKLFKDYFNETFTGYLTKLRMKEAKRLIQENESSLKEISYQIGYKDANYFSRVFKKHFAKSPRQFQREILNK